MSPADSAVHTVLGHLSGRPGDAHQNPWPPPTPCQALLSGAATHVPRRTHSPQLRPCSSLHTSQGDRHTSSSGSQLLAGSGWAGGMGCLRPFASHADTGTWLRHPGSCRLDIAKRGPSFVPHEAVNLITIATI